jgi:arabinogalactan oligomer/maltooligosaccharide transport system permease protein
MSIVAQGDAMEEGEGRTRDEGLTGLLFHPVALGTLLASLAAAILAHWFFGQARTDLRADQWNRSVIIELSALADTVAALEASDKDASPEQIATIVGRIAEDAEAETYYRVVRLSGARLLASNDPRDAADAPPPRRLAREEKPLFDLAQGIRASVETNRDEGVSRRRQVEVSEVSPGRMLVTLPYYVEGDVAGVVQSERNRPELAPGTSTVLLLAVILLPWLLVVGILAAMGRERRSVDVAETKPWLLFAIAFAIFSASILLFGRMGIAGVETLQTNLAGELAEKYSTLLERANFVAGQYGATVAPGEENRWDVDLYQRPMGLISPDGQIIESALAQQRAALTGTLSRSLWGGWAVGLLLLVFFALGYARRTAQVMREHRYAYFYVTPAMLAMLVLVFFPFFYGIVLSFSGQTILNVSEPLTDLLVGFQNYVDILGDFDIFRSTAEGTVINYQNFYWTLFITICWTVTNVLVGVTFGMLLALALNTKGLKFTNFYRVALILPWAIPNYITALIWKGMFHPQFGVINQAIQMFGGEPVAWFDGVFSAFMTGLITNGWLSFPFMMVVILGGLQSISQDMYEAAKVEGATRWQQFVNITLPSLKPTIIPAVIISVVWTFNMFNVIYLVSEGQPAGANEILITKSYKIAFEEYRYGYAAAYSVVIFLILLIYGVFQTKMTRATEANA